MQVAIDQLPQRGDLSRMKISVISTHLRSTLRVEILGPTPWLATRLLATRLLATRLLALRPVLQGFSSLIERQRLQYLLDFDVHSHPSRLLKKRTILL